MYLEWRTQLCRFARTPPKIQRGDAHPLGRDKVGTEGTGRVLQVRRGESQAELCGASKEVSGHVTDTQGALPCSFSEVKVEVLIISQIESWYVREPEVKQ